MSLKDNIPHWKKGRIQTPTLLQMEAVECGAASLGIVLSYFGRFEPLEILRDACGVSRDGSKASNILKAARSYGLEAKGFRMDIEDLSTLTLPLIVFWNFNHFLVLEGTRRGYFYLNDPAKGPRKVYPEEFDKSYTGVVLQLKPGPDFKKGGQRPSMVRSLKSRFGPVRLSLVYAMLCAFFLLLPGIVIPTFSQIFIDKVVVESMDGWFKPLLIAMITASLLQAGITYLQKYMLLRMQTKIAITQATRFLQTILKMPISFFFQRFAGDLTGRIQKNDIVAQVLANQAAPNIINIFLLVFYLAIMIQYDWVLSCAGTGMAMLNILALQFISRKKKDLNSRLSNEKSKLMGLAMTGLQLIETLKATGSESDFFSRWAGNQAKTINAQQQFSATSQLLSAIPPMLTTLNSACILGIGGFRIIAGDLTIGGLVAFQFLMAVFSKPVNELVIFGSTLQNTWGDIIQLDDVLRHDPDPLVDNDSLLEAVPENKPLKLKGRLVINNLCFGYSRLEPPLINNFNLTLNPSARVALVGASGSGKSTIAKVVSGLYPVWQGEIRLDNISLNELYRDTFTRSVGMVDQEIFLFEGSVRENLTMWDTAITDENIIRALKDARIYDVVMERPGGLDSRVEENGKNFSGGQRQRLEIARALVKNPSILIMDEATSALDPQTEKAVDEGIRRRGCTCIIIAHRLSTIRDADEIIVLERGRVVQRGTHDELKTVEGHYADLIAAQ